MLQFKIFQLSLNQFCKLGCIVNLRGFGVLGGGFFGYEGLYSNILYCQNITLINKCLLNPPSRQQSLKKLNSFLQTIIARALAQNKMTPPGRGLGSGRFCYAARLFFLITTKFLPKLSDLERLRVKF